MKKEWFAEWFDSPYYHTLYKNRDEAEAKRVIDHLLTALQLAPGARVLDLACGKGRHSKYLAEKGFDVTGLDISSASIDYARHYEHNMLHFYQHDMRLPFRVNYYDAILNMFTSFGYFDTEADHLKTLINVSKGLKPGGLCLIDFFNSVWVKNSLVSRDEKTVDNIHFTLKKRIRLQHVYKTIEFTTGHRHFVFRERVRLFTLADFERLMGQAGLEIIRVFGGYDLAGYEEKTSKRLILIAQKVVK